MCFANALASQFVDRYKGYQVPIAQARAIYKSAAQRKAKADLLRARPEKVDSTEDTAEAISDAINDSPSPFEAMEVSEGDVDETIADLAHEADDLLIDSAMSGFDDLDISKGSHSLLVDISSVLPNIPAKGSFDVNEIKVSVLVS